MFLQEFFPNNFFPIGFWAKLGAETVISTPARRTLTVPAVDRSCNVPSVSRVGSVAAADRTNTID